MRKHSFMDKAFAKPNYDPDDQGEFEPNLVFVIMRFSGGESADVYNAVKDECTKLELNARRADEYTGSGIVINEITQLIEDAEFIICDLTFERPNVYYELGYAHGVGNEPMDILLIAKEGTTIPFDIAPLRVEFYRSTEHLRSIVSQKLKVMIQETRR